MDWTMFNYFPLYIYCNKNVEPWILEQGSVHQGHDIF